MIRQSAAADYTGMRIGTGVQVRRFWRGYAWLSKLPAGGRRASRLTAGLDVGWLF